MADLTLVIHADPPLAFYRGDRPSAYDLAWPRLLDFGPLRQELRRGGGENPNVSARLDNGDGTLTEWLEDAPLLNEVSLHVDSDEIWRGALASLSVSGQIRLNLEA